MKSRFAGFFLLLYFISAGMRAGAAIIIDSVVVLPSTCQNNGSITVYATDQGSTLLYSIIAGPVTQLPQLNNNLTALPPGNYTVIVNNQAFNADTMVVAVGGNYVIPNPQPKVIYPLCRNSRGFQLTGNVDTGTGKPPFTWQLVAPSPVLVGPQGSDTFHITAAGTYAIQCTDACGNIQTRFFTFSDTIASNFSYAVSLNPAPAGCDSIRAGIDVRINGDSANIVFPLTLSIRNSHGNADTYVENNIVYDTTIKSATQLFFDGNDGGMAVAMATTLPNTTWGDTIYMTLTDGCGDSVSVISVIPPKQIFNEGWNSYPGDSCQTLYTATFDFFMYRPNNWIFEDSISHAVIASGTDTLPNDYVTENIISIDSNLLPGHSYTAIAYDACGDTLINTFTVPVLPPVNPACNVTITPLTCLDSTASAIISFSGFGSGVTLEIINGPAGSQSTKPGYDYSISYNFPQYFTMYTDNRFTVSDLAAGQYSYMLMDMCGDTIRSRFTVAPDSLNSFSNSFTWQKGCIDENSVSFNFYSAGAGIPGIAGISCTITNLDNYQVVFANSQISTSASGSVLNLPSGRYALNGSYYYEMSGLAPDSLCNSIHDTLVIPPYQNPAISVLVAEPCQGSFYIVVFADSSTGVYPYTYQVISGPETYPAQTDNKFLIHQTGTYTVRIDDACGNSSLKDISIDSLPTGIILQQGRIDSCFHAIINGHVYTGNAVITDTVLNLLGCDSLIKIDSIFIDGTTDTLFNQATDTFCSGKEDVITAPQNYTAYLWNNGTTSPTVEVLDAGIYSLTVTDIHGCKISDSLQVVLIDSPYITGGWTPQIAVCSIEPAIVTLSLNTTNARYEWNIADGSQYNLTRIISDTGVYVFTVFNHCGSSKYSISVSAKDCKQSFYIPNAFTPNGDGQNDVFKVYLSYPVQYFNMKLFNRWGEEVFETANENTGWNGFYRGVLQPMAVYTYEIEMASAGSSSIMAKGSFTLIR